jgi:hypothetical protein
VAAAVGVVTDVEGVAVAVVVAAVAFPFLEVAYSKDHQVEPFPRSLRCHTLPDSLEEACQMVEALQNGEEGHQRVAYQVVVLASCQEEAALCSAFHHLHTQDNSKLEKYVNNKKKSIPSNRHYLSDSDCHSDSQEILHPLWNTKVHYYVCKNPSLDLTNSPHSYTVFMIYSDNKILFVSLVPC